MHEVLVWYNSDMEKFATSPVEQKNTMPPIEKYKSLILDNHQTSEHPFMQKGNPEKFYDVSLEGAGKKITFLGTEHTNNPANPVFGMIDAKFQELKPDMVYVEGMGFINAQKDGIRSEIKKMTPEYTKTKGEGAYTLKCAIDSGADFESPEPQFSQEIANALKKFSKKDILTFYMYRAIEQYQRKNKVRNIEDCKKVLYNEVGEFAEESHWDESEVNAIALEVLRTLDVDNHSFYRDQVSPTFNEERPRTVINDVSTCSSDFRDQYIFERIADGIKNHKSVFVVYGSAHAVRQEPALRALMQDMQESK